MKLSKYEKLIIVILLMIVLLTVAFFIISDMTSPELSISRVSFPDSGAANADAIDINSASLEQLKSLDGIGDGMARKIIDYRENKHPFSVPSDILNVDGIGLGIYDNIKDKICVR